MSTQPTASHFINGAYVEDTAGEEIPVIYPATGEVIATLHAATPAIVDQALAVAKAAQTKWAGWSGTERGRVLRLHASRTFGRLRRHWRVELPHANCLLERGTCAGLRQHDGVQTIRDDAALRAQSRGNHDRGWRAGRRV